MASLSGHDETNYASTSNAPRGNVTQESRQIIQSSTAATSTYTYDETGQVTSVKDARGNTTGYVYSDSYASGFGAPPGGKQTNASLTQVNLPSTGSPVVNHVETFTYRYNDGQLASSKSQNSQTTAYSYADALGRLTATNYPDGGQTTETYNDSVPSVTATTVLTSASSLTSTTIMDGAGHAIQSQLNSDPSGTDKTDTVFDGLGRVYSVSNPYRSTSDGSYGITQYQYDALGRTTQRKTPDGATVATSYSGPSTTVTDQAGNQRTAKADALGRIKQVVEDPGSPVCSSTVAQPCHFNYSTSYTYDALDDLTGVNQSGMTRTFVYDSLKRLTQATNPESGVIKYTYDLNGNLLTKTDARPKTITYGPYDALNRNTGKQYSDTTPAVTYAYDTGSDGIGLLASVANGSSTTNYQSFDAMGRVLTSNQVTAGQTYPFGYTYNLAGSLTSETYPSSRTVTTGYDGANRPISATGLLGSAQANYVSGALYAPPGGLSSYQYGNNLARQITYNPRLQTSTYSDTNSNTAVQLIGATLGWGTTANNGNLLSAAYVNLGTGTPSSLSFTQNYGYDALNRLTSAGDSGWSRSFGYDAFGNMWVTANSGVTRQGNTPTSSSAFNANNQIATTPSSYDAAGNQTLVNGDTQVYDAENRQISSTYAGASETYFYDGNGQRVEKSGASGTTVFVYDAMGALAAEYSTAASTPPCTTCYLSADHLGSTRLVTDGGANVIGRHDYLPFGEEIAANTAGRNGQWGAGNDPVNQKFTGKERDAESGLDYFGARYLGSGLGRFTSPDPAFESEILELPQTWNRYSYVYNRPLSITDPDGRCPPCIGALIGGVVEGGWNLGTQLYQNGGDLSNVSWSEVGANAAGGAVAGAIAGATGGGSLVADALWGAGANVAGGIVTRTVEGDDAGGVLAPGDIAVDALSGFVGGGAGHLAADLVHIPEEPDPLGRRRHAVGRRKLAKYDAAVATRQRAIGVQVGIGTAAGSPPTHSTAAFIDNFWSVLDWLIFTPENREPKACVSVSDSASASHFGGCN